MPEKADHNGCRDNKNNNQN